jgi:UDP-N-acetylmuramate dehydrogenase
MQIHKDYDLTNLNTFGVKATAKFFAEVHSVDDLLDVFKTPEFRENKKLFLGGGSNILFTQDFYGIVIKVSILGKQIVKEDENNVIIEISAGENWHDIVTYTVENNWGGIENLALIPGTVGAAPVQNIAAYGQNLSDVFESLDAFNSETGGIEKFDKEQCEFAYRGSVFKTRFKGKYLVTKIRLKLSKKTNLETSYYQIGISRDSIKEEMSKTNQGPYSIKDVYNAVVNIRRRKLPDPSKIPTAGSFFLNAVVSKEKYEELKKQVPELQCYPPDQLNYVNPESVKNLDFVKIATGRLLQDAGWLGKWIGNVGIHDRHALVVVTNGKASGQEILKFAEGVMSSIYEKYGIQLVPEVNFI